MTELTNQLQVTLPPPRCYLACRHSPQMLQGRLYTADHYWMQPESPGIWRVGLTPWLIRILGHIEDFRLDVAPGSATSLGQRLGALEGLHAVVKVRAPMAGTFLQRNPILGGNLEMISQDGCGTGWLYLIQGTPDPDACDVTGYRRMLDDAIDGVCGAGPTLQ